MKTVPVAVVIWLSLAVGCQTTTRAPHAIAGPPDVSDSATSTQQNLRLVTHVEPVEFDFVELPLVELPPVEAPPPQAGSLRLEDLEAIALTANPTLAATAAHVEAAHGRWVQAGLLPNTVLGYTGQQLGSHGQAEQQGIFVSQEWIRGGKVRLDQAIACEETRLAEQRLAMQQQRVLTDVRLGFYEVLIAQERVGVAQEGADSAADALRTSEALLAAMEISQINVLRSKIERKQAELVLGESQYQLDAAWSRLTASLGTPGRPRAKLIGDLHSVQLAIDPQEALDRILGSSPELAAAMSGIERARRAVDRAHAEATPNAEIQATFQTDNGTGSNNTNLQVALPIPWLNRNQGGILAAHAELVAAERSITSIELRLQRQLATVFRRYISAWDQVHAYSQAGGILEQAGASLEFVDQAYTAGELGYLERVTAQQTYTRLNLSFIDSLGDMWSAAVEVEGLLLRDGFEHSP